MNFNNKKWQAERDADTLAEYNEILNDKPRLNRALKEAKKQVDNLNSRMNTLNKGIKSVKGKK